MKDGIRKLFTYAVFGASMGFTYHAEPALAIGVLFFLVILLVDASLEFYGLELQKRIDSLGEASNE